VTVPTTNFGMYLNYADPTLTTQQAQNNYWLGHYARLAEIKNSVDPKNVFNNPQTVGRK
jgi:FAD/FMN-containing dehydrogenase